ncbi:hypothetical protein [Winogradskya humida]|uniref:LppX_LprAFG lipoprotein n=1 Tax=Winogradskya humida TaxID=113566 RepID=A0ABQ4A7L6_9ACTN|nr:hypothetical protein [Actinoplanes humidus]GIE26851.1 hypothetical protein Ahu01nite_099530 [Actinoplanes humidus]
MSPTRTLRYGLLAVLIGATALAGCTRHDTAPVTTPGSSPAPPASELLADAARDLKQTSFAMTLTIGLSQGTGTLTGTIDPVKKVGAFTATTTGRGDDSTITEWRMLGTTLYAKSTTNGVATNTTKPWRRLNGEAANGLAKAFDAANMAQALTKATAVRRSDNTHFAGTLDSATASSAFGLSAPTTDSQTGASKLTTAFIAFTADTDDRYRLIGYRATVRTSTGQSRKASLAFSEFGITVLVQAPPPSQIAGSTIS